MSASARRTLGAIGQRAGVSPGLVAHYFDDKDGLLEATLRSLAARLGRAAAGAAPGRAHAARPRAGGDRRHARAGGVRPAHLGVWLAFWGQVIHSARLQARPERLSAPHALEPAPCARSSSCRTPTPSRIAIATRRDDRRPVASRHALLAATRTDSATARAMATAFIDGEIARSPRQGRCRDGGAAARQRASARARNYIGGALGRARPAARPSRRSTRRPARSSPRSRSPARPRSTRAVAAAQERRSPTGRR